jgi:hypothetical protein
MQRYMPTFFQMSNGPETWAGMKEDSQDGEWYSRADVDARIAELVEALRIYGGHIPPCKGRPCECGFRETWERNGLMDRGNNRG